MQILVLSYMAALIVHFYTSNKCQQIILREEWCWIYFPDQPLTESAWGGQMHLPALASPGLSGCAHLPRVSVNHKGWSKS